FDAIELGFPDLLSFANSRSDKEVANYDYDELCEAGEEIRKLCAKLGLKVLVLQPFANWEGWADGSEGRKDAGRRAEGWVRIMKAVGTDMLQVGSSDSPASKINTSHSHVVANLRNLADLLAPHSYRLAYENWCWSTHAPTWKSVWKIVKAVDRPNVGLCLDTFQTAGSEWADPTTASGLIEDHPGGTEGLERDFRNSLQELAREVPKEKIYFLQISDAYKLERPLSKGADDSGLRSRGRWSHDYRPMPFDGGYLPVVDVARAVLKTGFRGWFSMEIFDGGRDGRGKEYDLGEFAKKAMESHKRLLEECAED
ncbi:MAG: hypothetical protein LQ347_005541, partial [Umbilicaria vellea]